VTKTTIIKPENQQKSAAQALGNNKAVMSRKREKNSREPNPKNMLRKMSDKACEFIPEKLSKSIQKCNKAPKVLFASGQQSLVNPSLYLNVLSKKTYFTGLQKCNCNICPQCCNMKYNNHKDQILFCVSVAKKQGFQIFMKTLTIRHNKGQSCSDLVKTCKASYRKFKKSRTYRNLEKDYLIFTISSFEITQSLKNGFHPHYHILFFIRPKKAHLLENPVEPKNLMSVFTPLWIDSVSKVDANCTPSKMRGCTIEESYNDEKLSTYATKYSTTAELEKYLNTRKMYSEHKWSTENEMTGAMAKKGYKARNKLDFSHRSMFEILFDITFGYSENESLDKQIFLEYAEAINRKQLVNYGTRNKNFLNFCQEVRNMEIEMAKRMVFEMENQERINSEDLENAMCAPIEFKETSEILSEYNSKDIHLMNVSGGLMHVLNYKHRQLYYDILDICSSDNVLYHKAISICEQDEIINLVYEKSNLKVAFECDSDGSLLLNFESELKPVIDKPVLIVDDECGQSIDEILNEIIAKSNLPF